MMPMTLKLLKERMIVLISVIPLLKPDRQSWREQIELIDNSVKEVTREMKKQYFQKIQDYQYDPRRPEFFIINSDKCVQEIAPELDLIPGTVLALKQNWWAAYQIDVDDDIYLDNILPHFEHWLARLQELVLLRMNQLSMDYYNL